MRLPAVALALAIGACSVAKHPLPDAGQPDAAQRSMEIEFKAEADPLLKCPIVRPCQPEPAPSFVDTDAFVLLASAVGADVHFVAIGNTSVLAERGEPGEPILVRVASGDPMGEKVAFSVVPLPTDLEAPKPIGLFGWDENEYVLLCGSRECEVLDTDVDPPVRIATLDGGEDAVNGIAVPSCYESAYNFCVLSAGLSCFDGTSWTTEIEPAPDQRILAVAFDPSREGCPLRLASGAHGALWRHDEKSWRAIETQTTSDLTTVALHSGRFTVAGANTVIEGDPFGLRTCEAGGLAPLELQRWEASLNCTKPRWDGDRQIDQDGADRGFDTVMYGFTASGQFIYTHDGCSGAEQWNCYEQPEPILDLSMWSCGLNRNRWQLTRDALTGSFACWSD